MTNMLFLMASVVFLITKIIQGTFPVIHFYFVCLSCRTRMILLDCLMLKTFIMKDIRMKEKVRAGVNIILSNSENKKYTQKFTQKQKNLN